MQKFTMKRRTSFIRVLYATSEKSADLFYLTKIFVPDPFLCVIVGNHSIAVVNRLEYGRMRTQSSCDEVLLLETVKSLAAEALNLDSHISIRGDDLADQDRDGVTRPHDATGGCRPSPS